MPVGDPAFAGAAPVSAREKLNSHGKFHLGAKMTPSGLEMAGLNSKVVGAEIFLSWLVLCRKTFSMHKLAQVILKIHLFTQAVIRIYEKPKAGLAPGPLLPTSRLILPFFLVLPAFARSLAHA